MMQTTMHIGAHFNSQPIKAQVRKFTTFTTLTLSNHDRAEIQLFAADIKEFRPILEALGEALLETDELRGDG